MIEQAQVEAEILRAVYFGNLDTNLCEEVEERVSAVFLENPEEGDAQWFREEYLVPARDALIDAGYMYESAPYLGLSHYELRRPGILHARRLFGERVNGPRWKTWD